MTTHGLLRRSSPSPRAQRGMSPITVLLICGAIGFCMLMVFRIAPIYMADATVGAALKGIEQEPGVAQMSPYEIRNRLQRRFDVNDIDIKTSDVQIKKDSRTIEVSLKYETRKPLIANLEVVASFNHVQHINLAPGGGATP